VRGALEILWRTDVRLSFDRVIVLSFFSVAGYSSSCGAMKLALAAFEPWNEAVLSLFLKFYLCLGKSG
jgi:hypothetical protein